jgi:caffeoyl-CoA O-methyltransferase
MRPKSAYSRTSFNPWHSFSVFTGVAIGITLVILISLLWFSTAARPPVIAATESERRILTTIDEAFRTGETYANVPPADGHLLRLMAEAVDAKNVVEIGTSTGISGMWLCLALEKTGGKLNTFELDPGRAAIARRHFERAGVSRLVNLVEGDAHRNLAKVDGPVDLAFIDAEKSGYIDYLNQVLPLVRSGGLILAHNADMVRDYVAAVKRNSALETVLFTEGAGMVVSLKKR